MFYKLLVILSTISLLVQDGSGKPHEPVKQSAGTLEVESNEGAKRKTSEKDYFTYPKYKYSYGVGDLKSGDYKTHVEERDGDAVYGEYKITDPNGVIRTVKYRADDEHGFQAVVVTNENGHEHSESFGTADDTNNTNKKNTKTSTLDTTINNNEKDSQASKNLETSTLDTTLTNNGAETQGGKRLESKDAKNEDKYSRWNYNNFKYEGNAQNSKILENNDVKNEDKYLNTQNSWNSNNFEHEEKSSHSQTGWNSKHKDKSFYSVNSKDSSHYSGNEDSQNRKSSKYFENGSEIVANPKHIQYLTEVQQINKPQEEYRKGDDPKHTQYLNIVQPEEGYRKLDDVTTNPKHIQYLNKLNNIKQEDRKYLPTQEQNIKQEDRKYFSTQEQNIKQEGTKYLPTQEQNIKQEDRKYLPTQEQKVKPTSFNVHNQYTSTFLDGLDQVLQRNEGYATSERINEEEGGLNTNAFLSEERKVGNHEASKYHLIKINGRYTKVGKTRKPAKDTLLTERQPVGNDYTSFPVDGNTSLKQESNVDASSLERDRFANVNTGKNLHNSVPANGFNSDSHTGRITRVNPPKNRHTSPSAKRITASAKNRHTSPSAERTITLAKNPHSYLPITGVKKSHASFSPTEESLVNNPHSYLPITGVKKSHASLSPTEESPVNNPYSYLPITGVKKSHASEESPTNDLHAVRFIDEPQTARKPLKDIHTYSVQENSKDTNAKKNIRMFRRRKPQRKHVKPAEVKVTEEASTENYPDPQLFRAVVENYGHHINHHNDKSKSYVQVLKDESDPGEPIQIKGENNFPQSLMTKLKESKSYMNVYKENDTPKTFLSVSEDDQASKRLHQRPRGSRYRSRTNSGSDGDKEEMRNPKQYMRMYSSRNNTEQEANVVTDAPKRYRMRRRKHPKFTSSVDPFPQYGVKSRGVKKYQVDVNGSEQTEDFNALQRIQNNEHEAVKKPEAAVQKNNQHEGRIKIGHNKHEAVFGNQNENYPNVNFDYQNNHQQEFGSANNLRGSTKHKASKYEGNSGYQAHKQHANGQQRGNVVAEQIKHIRKRPKSEAQIRSQKIKQDETVSFTPSASYYFKKDQPNNNQATHNYYPDDLNEKSKIAHDVTTETEGISHLNPTGIVNAFEEKTVSYLNPTGNAAKDVSSIYFNPAGNAAKGSIDTIYLNPAKESVEKSYLNPRGNAAKDNADANYLNPAPESKDTSYSNPRGNAAKDTADAIYLNPTKETVDPSYLNPRGNSGKDTSDTIYFNPAADSVDTSYFNPTGVAGKDTVDTSFPNPTGNVVEVQQGWVNNPFEETQNVEKDKFLEKNLGKSAHSYQQINLQHVPIESSQSSHDQIFNTNFGHHVQHLDYNIEPETKDVDGYTVSNEATLKSNTEPTANEGKNTYQESFEEYPGVNNNGGIQTYQEIQFPAGNEGSSEQYPLGLEKPKSNKAKNTYQEIHFEGGNAETLEKYSGGLETPKTNGGTKSYQEIHSPEGNEESVEKYSGGFKKHKTNGGTKSLIEIHSPEKNEESVEQYSGGFKKHKTNGGINTYQEIHFEGDNKERFEKYPGVLEKPKTNGGTKSYQEIHSPQESSEQHPKGFKKHKTNGGKNTYQEIHSEEGNKDSYEKHPGGLQKPKTNGGTKSYQEIHSQEGNEESFEQHFGGFKKHKTNGGTKSYQEIHSPVGNEESFEQHPGGFKQPRTNGGKNTYQEIHFEGGNKHSLEKYPGGLEKPKTNGGTKSYQEIHFEGGNEESLERYPGRSENPKTNGGTKSYQEIHSPEGNVESFEQHPGGFNKHKANGRKNTYLPAGGIEKASSSKPKSKHEEQQTYQETHSTSGNEERLQTYPGGTKSSNNNGGTINYQEIQFPKGYEAKLQKYPNNEEIQTYQETHLLTDNAKTLPSSGTLNQQQNNFGQHPIYIDDAPVALRLKKPQNTASETEATQGIQSTRFASTHEEIPQVQNYQGNAQTSNPKLQTKTPELVYYTTPIAQPLGSFVVEESPENVVEEKLNDIKTTIDENVNKEIRNYQNNAALSHKETQGNFKVSNGQRYNKKNQDYSTPHSYSQVDNNFVNPPSVENSEDYSTPYSYTQEVNQFANAPYAGKSSKNEKPVHFGQDQTKPGEDLKKYQGEAQVEQNLGGVSLYSYTAGGGQTYHPSSTFEYLGLLNKHNQEFQNAIKSAEGTKDFRGGNYQYLKVQKEHHGPSSSNIFKSTNAQKQGTSSSNGLEGNNQHTTLSSNDNQEAQHYWNQQGTSSSSEFEGTNQHESLPLNGFDATNAQIGQENWNHSKTSSSNEFEGTNQHGSLPSFKANNAQKGQDKLNHRGTSSSSKFEGTNQYRTLLLNTFEATNSQKGQENWNHPGTSSSNEFEDTNQHGSFPLNANEATNAQKGQENWNHHGIYSSNEFEGTNQHGSLPSNAFDGTNAQKGQEHLNHHRTSSSSKFEGTNQYGTLPSNAFEATNAQKGQENLNHHGTSSSNGFDATNKHLNQHGTLPSNAFETTNAQKGQKNLNGHESGFKATNQYLSQHGTPPSNSFEATSANQHRALSSNSFENADAQNNHQYLNHQGTSPSEGFKDSNAQQEQSLNQHAFESLKYLKHPSNSFESGALPSNAFDSANAQKEHHHLIHRVTTSPNAFEATHQHGAFSSNGFESTNAQKDHQNLNHHGSSTINGFEGMNKQETSPSNTFEGTNQNLATSLPNVFEGTKQHHGTSPRLHSLNHHGTSLPSAFKDTNQHLNHLATSSPNAFEGTKQHHGTSLRLHSLNHHETSSPNAFEDTNQHLNHQGTSLQNSFEGTNQHLDHHGTLPTKAFQSTNEYLKHHEVSNQRRGNQNNKDASILSSQAAKSYIEVKTKKTPAIPFKTNTEANLQLNTGEITLNQRQQNHYQLADLQKYQNHEEKSHLGQLSPGYVFNYQLTDHQNHQNQAGKLSSFNRNSKNEGHLGSVENGSSNLKPTGSDKNTVESSSVNSAGIAVQHRQEQKIAQHQQNIQQETNARRKEAIKHIRKQQEHQGVLNNEKNGQDSKNEEVQQESVQKVQGDLGNQALLRQRLQKAQGNIGNQAVLRRKQERLQKAQENSGHQQHLSQNHPSFLSSHSEEDKLLASNLEQNLRKQARLNQNYRDLRNHNQKVEEDQFSNQPYIQQNQPSYLNSNSESDWSVPILGQDLGSQAALRRNQETNQKVLLNQNQRRIVNNVDNQAHSNQNQERQQKVLANQNQKGLGNENYGRLQKDSANQNHDSLLKDLVDKLQKTQEDSGHQFASNSATLSQNYQNDRPFRKFQPSQLIGTTRETSSGFSPSQFYAMQPVYQDGTEEAFVQAGGFGDRLRAVHGKPSRYVNYDASHY